MTRLRRGYGEAGGSRWIGFSRRRSQIIRQRRKNQAAKAAYAANALRTTRSTARRPRESIESFTRTIIARWLRGSLLRCIIRSRNKQRLYARSWIAAAIQRGLENICDKFISALPEPTGWQLRQIASRRSTFNYDPRRKTITVVATSMDTGYFGARDATIFSKHGSPRKGSQNGSSFNWP